MLLDPAHLCGVTAMQPAYHRGDKHIKRRYVGLTRRWTSFLPLGRCRPPSVEGRVRWELEHLVKGYDLDVSTMFSHWVKATLWLYRGGRLEHSHDSLFACHVDPSGISLYSNNWLLVYSICNASCRWLIFS